MFSYVHYRNITDSSLESHQLIIGYYRRSKGSTYEDHKNRCEQTLFHNFTFISFPLFSIPSTRLATYGGHILFSCDRRPTCVGDRFCCNSELVRFFGITCEAMLTPSLENRIFHYRHTASATSSGGSGCDGNAIARKRSVEVIFYNVRLAAA